ncbi:LacI family DNA-binding transcriptional regulator [Seohaeicola saemankumensis]|nr:LacI family DNA-binding transcriptional regulator [Seohaeicola saemankumensis]MCA0872772.1 LacI family DNA-binding transcriptional regulator [Seohaeicola saemankumensis]
MRTTVSQIAREAGVSSATVDRVLNDRDGVRPRTRDIVLQVARKLGYFGPVDAEPLSAPVRLDFVLPAGSNSFMRTLKANLMQESSTRDDVTATLHEIEGFDPERLSAKLFDLRQRTDAVGLVALDHPQVREAINALAASGVRIGTLVSDIPTVNKVGYVGVDNRAAGRLAGLLLGRFLPPGQHRIAVFVGSLAYRGHEEREMGVRAILSEDFPEIRIVGTAEVSDDRDRAYVETMRFLERGDITGIYNIGSGNQGIARALREARMEREVVFVGHDLTDATRLMLLDRTMDAVIDQNPRVEAREIVRLLASSVRGTVEPEYLPRLQVVFRENIPTA